MEHLLGAAVLVLNLSRKLRELETFLEQDIVYFRLYDLLNHSLQHQRGQIRPSCDDFAADFCLCWPVSTSRNIHNSASSGLSGNYRSF